MGLSCGTLTLWQHANFNGRTASCSTDCTDLFEDDMNDETSSLVVCEPDPDDCPRPDGT